MGLECPKSLELSAVGDLKLFAAGLALEPEFAGFVVVVVVVEHV